MIPREREIEQEVRTRFDSEQVALLAELVEQSSCSREPDDVELAARILDREARELGLEVRVVPDPEGKVAAHRVYSTPAASNGAPALALVGHIDTVFPRASGFSGFQREGDVARGPGVLDMKSGLTSIFFALRALRAFDPARYTKLPLRVLVVSDEEIGSPSSRALFAELAPQTTEALIFEAGRVGDRIVTTRKGGGLFSISAQGRAAHAGNAHHDGVSAIWAMSLLIPKIEALTDYPRGVTVNVGLIEGGTAKNTVPEHATIGIDARFERRVDADALLAALQALVSDPFGEDSAVPDKLRGVRFELGGGVTRPPMEATDATRSLRLRYERAAERAGLAVGEAPLQGGGSDANLLAALGVPCIDGLGPWGQYFHETREWCSLESLRKRTTALALFLDAL